MTHGREKRDATRWFRIGGGRFRTVTLLFVLNFVGASQKTGSEISLLAAVESALQKHPSIQVAELQIQLSRAQLQIASSAFDHTVGWQLSQGRIYSPLLQPDWFYNSRGALVDHTTANTSDAGFSSSMLLRNGIAVSPATMTLNRDTSNEPFFGGSSSWHYAFQMNVPLFRGRGKEVTTAPERQAGLEVSATTLDARQAAATVVENVVVSYWNLVAAESNLAIALQSEERGAALLANTKALIAGDQLPQIEIHNAEANLANRRAARVESERLVRTGQAQLIFDMGLKTTDLLMDFKATDSLPDWRLALPPASDLETVRQFLAGALARRADYSAGRARIAELDIASRAAKNTLLPQIDFGFSGGYAGLNEGKALSSFLLAPGSRVRGPDIVAQLTYQFSPSNNLAKGKVAQAEAQSRLANVQQEDLARTIGSAITVNLENLRDSIIRARVAHDAVIGFQAALDGEQEKLKFGTGSIMDVLNVEDRLVSSLQSELQARLACSVAAVQLRFDIGSLVSLGGGPTDLTYQTFATVPKPDGGIR
jgi:outer membrane protein TolC